MTLSLSQLSLSKIGMIFVGSQVSGVHCKIFSLEGNFELEDTSRNGTLWNDQRLQKDRKTWKKPVVAHVSHRNICKMLCPNRQGQRLRLEADGILSLSPTARHLSPTAKGLRKLHSQLHVSS